ncbi:YbgA family protein [Nonomuraea sp. NPDC005983]|uniref:YbgA family protein n=1 Tax=Nonomuraea sp. NPDC005983 TaxID=3155595 RepID=UPI0033ADFD22
MTRPRVAVSSGLLGEPGGHSRERFLYGPLDPYVDWVPIYPETKAGLGSLDVDGYVFKAVPVSGPPLERGVFAADGTDARPLLPVEEEGRLHGAHPLLPVQDEGRLHDAQLRERFVERLFAHARLREFLDSDWRPHDLVAFHARHKMQLLAHDPAGYRETGRAVAQAGVRPSAELAAAYADRFRAALVRKATVGKNVNVLHHCMGMIALAPGRRAQLLEAIDVYRAGLVPLCVPAALLLLDARGEAAAYVRAQSYFSPYPDDLRPA